MRAKKLFIALLLSLLLPMAGYANPLPCDSPSPCNGFPLTEADIESIKKILVNHFSEQDVDRLVGYFRDATSGKEAAFPPELMQRLLSAIAELRLEYGFQMTVILAQLKKSAQHVFNQELDEILNQLEQSLVQ